MSGKHRFKRLLAGAVCLSLVLMSGNGIVLANGDQWSYSASEWEYNKREDSLTHKTDGAGAWAEFTAPVDAAKSFTISYDVEIDTGYVFNGGTCGMQIRLQPVGSRDYFMTKIKYNPTNSRWGFVRQFYSGKWTNFGNTGELFQGPVGVNTATVSLSHTAGETDLVMKVVAGGQTLINDDVSSILSEGFFDGGVKFAVRAGDGGYKDVFTVSDFSIVNDGSQLVLPENPFGLDDDFDTLYTETIGEEQWSFSGSDDRWFLDETGGLLRRPGAGETAFLPAIDASKPFRLAFDLTLDLAHCRSDFPSFQIRLTDGGRSESYLFIRVKYSPSNNEWLVEPQYSGAGRWENINVGRSWVKGDGSPTVRIILYKAQEGQLLFVLKAGDSVLCSGDLYTDSMERFLSDGQLQLCFHMDSPDNDTVAIGDMSFISGREQLFNAGDGGAAVPPEDTYNGDADSRGVNFSAGDLQLVASQRLYQTPNTIEAWIKVPQDVGDGRIGVIVGNNGFKTFNEHHRYVSMEIAEKGAPRLLWINKSKKTDFVVSGVDVRNGRWTHLAFVRDTEAKKLLCYVDGEKAGEKEIDDIEECVPSEALSISGDWHMDNPLYFLGSIADVRLWNGAKSAEQVKAGMNQPTRKEGGLLAGWSLSESAAPYRDVSAYGNDMVPYGSMWRKDIEEEPGDYSFVIFPDTQIMTMPAPNPDYSDYFRAMVQWVLDNREKENIQFLMHLGDLVTFNTDYEYDLSKEIMEQLDGVLPYSISLGNHDYDRNSPKDTSSMNALYPLSLFEEMPTFGGAFDDTMDNTYHLLTVQGHKYMILALDFGPSDEVLAWANEVVAAHADYQVIVTTHGYMFLNGDLLTEDTIFYPSEYNADSNDADDMWDKFIGKHENILMVLSGHIDNEDIVMVPREGEKGNVVYQLLLDSQGLDGRLNGAGLLSLLRFTDNGTKVHVSYYSPYRDAHYKINNQFTIDLTAGIVDPGEMGDAQTTTTTGSNAKETTASAGGEATGVPTGGGETAGVSTAPDAGGPNTGAAFPLGALAGALTASGGVMLLRKRRRPRGKNNP